MIRNWICSLIPALALTVVHAVPTGQTIFPENLNSKFRYNLKQFCPVPIPANYDYSDAIKSGLRMLYDNGGGTLELDPGTYKVCQEIALIPEVPNNSGSLNSAIRITGSGGRMESTKITCPQALPAGSRAFFVFDGINSANYSVTMEHLIIEGDPGRWAWGNIAGVRLISREALFLNDVMFRNLKDGVSMYSGQPNIEYSKFAQIGRYAIDISEAGDGLVSKCEFAQIGCDLSTSGLCSSQSWASAAIYAGGDQVLSRCVIGSTFGSGIRVGGERGGELDIVHNQFDNISRVMIFDDKSVSDPHMSTNILFDGNKVEGFNDGANLLPGYVNTRRNPILGYVQGNLIGSLKIVNNRFCGLAPNSIGFEITNGEDILIEGNSFSDLYSMTRQNILGKLLAVSNTTKLNFSGNAVHVGESQNSRSFATLDNVTGIFTNNLFSGYSTGFVNTNGTSLQCRDNIGWNRPGHKSDATYFVDPTNCFVRR